jgi:hypothetical protein
LGLPYHPKSSSKYQYGAMIDSNCIEQLIRSSFVSQRPTPLPDVRVFTGPCTKCLKLALRLAHPCTEKIEFSKTRGASFGIPVNRVKAFVVFHKAYNIVLLCGGYESVVMRQ